MSENRHSIFITGGSGYMGQRLIPRLLARGHDVRALVRPGSEKKLASGCIPITGNALDGASYADCIAPTDTFVQLVGVAHPAPMMHTYIAVRSECEAAIEAAGLDATILSPWYVPGPGHWWPYLLLPMYKLAELVPATSEGAQRLG